MRVLTLEDSRQGKGPGSQARPRSRHVHTGQEQRQLSQGQLASLSGARRTGGKAWQAGRPDPTTEAWGTHDQQQEEFGAWDPRPRGPEGTNFRYATGLLQSSTGEEGKGHFAIFQLEALRPGRS